MKLAFLLTQLEVGGAQVRVLQTADELRARGHQVDVFFLYRRRDVFKDEEKIILSPRGGVLGIVRAAAALRMHLRRGRYDALITNTAPANIIGQTVALMSGLKQRISCQTQPPSRLNAVYRALDLVCGVFGIYRFNIANSEWTHSCFDRYPQTYRKRLHIIPDGIEPRVSDKSRQHARHALGFDADAKIILNIGRLSQQKGQETLLKALPNVPGAVLAIAGDGELREQLQAMARNLGVADRVRFFGEIPGDQIALLMRASDVFAFTSRWETFGLAVVEAAASGLPIIASDLDVLHEVLETEDRKSAAIFVPADDAEALANEIARVLSDAELNAALRNESLRVAKRHSIARHVDNLLAGIAST